MFLSFKSQGWSAVLMHNEGYGKWQNKTLLRLYMIFSAQINMAYFILFFPHSDPTPFVYKMSYTVQSIHDGSNQVLSYHFMHIQIILQFYTLLWKPQLSWIALRSCIVCDYILLMWKDSCCPPSQNNHRLLCCLDRGRSASLQSPLARDKRAAINEASRVSE